METWRITTDDGTVVDVEAMSVDMAIMLVGDEGRGIWEDEIVSIKSLEWA